MTTASARTIVCVVCDAPFTYPYTGGRDRRTCDQPACMTGRKTTNKRTERDRHRPREKPDGTTYVPADYPHNIPGVPALDGENWSAVVERTRWYRDRHRLRSQPEGVKADRRSVSIRDRADSVSDLLVAGHGYVLDDQRDRDEAPLRLIPRDDRGAVGDWFRVNGFPLVGMSGAPVMPGDRTLYVLGSLDVQAPTDPPRRITRRFCSRDALVPLEPFTLRI
jgi:hypothetical protein